MKTKPKTSKTQTKLPGSQHPTLTKSSFRLKLISYWEKNTEFGQYRTLSNFHRFLILLTDLKKLVNENRTSLDFFNFFLDFQIRHMYTKTKNEIQLAHNIILTFTYNVHLTLYGRYGHWRDVAWTLEQRCVPVGTTYL